MSETKFPNRKPQIIIVPNRDFLARSAAERFVALAHQCIETRGQFSVALSGGSTPLDLYSLLAQPEFATQVDWAHVFLFWGDERNVPPQHPDCNYGATYEALITHVPVPPENVYRIPSEKEPAEAAREYEACLRKFFSPQNDSMSSKFNLSTPFFPRFDLVLLGLGNDGHTASLFPHTHFLHETQRWVATEYITKVGMHRITLTVPVINAASNILWLVAGADKAQAVHAVLRGEYRPKDLPAQLIQPTNGTMTWLLDAEASKKLE